MWRRKERFCWSKNDVPRPRVRLISVSALLAVALSAMAVYSQDTTPPPPPDDQSAAAPDQSQPASPSSDQAQNPGQSSVRAVRLSDVEGQVQVYQGDQVDFNQAQPNMPAIEGMRFVTGDNGRLEIELEDGSVARVTPNSSVRLAQLRRNPDGSTVTEIDALSGLSYYELNEHAGQVLVRFGRDTATPDGSSVFRIEEDTVPNELAVMHGSVHVSDGQSVDSDVHPNQTFQTDPQQAGQYTVAQSISSDSWDQWNSDRDQALGELESSETTARASSGNPDDAAWNDLDYYGSWYNLPGYGQVWSPNGVDSGWDPFGNGYWGYYSTFGYTWISSYPWGWWPYHCGAWDFLSGWGWVWVPGNCGWGLWGAGWYPYATVWRVPPGYVLPRRPPNRPGHYPGPRPEPLIAVNRGSQFTAPFRSVNAPRPAPRPLEYGGRSIAPLQAEVHPQQKGPMGETFTSTLVRTHPEMVPPALRNPTASGYRRTYSQPGNEVRTFGPTPGYVVPHVGQPAPRRAVYTGPRPAPGGEAPHPMPAPHPSGGGAAAPHPSGGAVTPHR